MKEEKQLNLIFFALSDPTRRDIISRLLGVDMSIGALAESYDASLPAISKHIQVLNEANVVNIEKIGRSRLVTLNMDTLDIAQIWLATIDAESSFFDRLEAEIEKINSGESEI